MKKPVLYSIGVVFAFAAISLGFTTQPQSVKIPEIPQSLAVEISPDIQALLDRSCLPCHGPDGSGKAKMKWNYEKMDEYSTSKLVSKLVKISEVVAEEDMPPPKKIKKKPELDLTAAERETLSKWADNAAESLAGNN